jgi:hypothetical protein
VVGSYVLSRRWQGELALGYFWGGGLDSRSRALFPLLSGPNVAVSANHRLTLRDVLSVNVAGYAYRARKTRDLPLGDGVAELQVGTWTDRKVRLGTAEGAWAHRIGPLVAAHGAAGAAVSGDATVLPSGRVGSTVGWRTGSGLWAWQTNLSVAPEIAPLQGYVDERASVVTQLDWQSQSWQWGLGVGAGRSLLADSATGTTTLAAASTAGLRLSDSWLAQAGVRWMLYRVGDSWQPQRFSPFLALVYGESFDSSVRGGR